MNITTRNIALGIIDEQRGFMPASEGIRLGQQGFGELPVPGGEEIITPTNQLLGAFAAIGADVFTTQDWHPHITAHFSDNPDFATNWPVHCVDGTLGAELHPELELPAYRERFIKGFEPLEHGEDDTSYSAHYAEHAATGISLPEWLRHRQPETVYLAGLALDYCVGKTALDLKVKDGFDVTVVLDATRGISPESTNATLEEFAANGVKVTDTRAVLAELKAMQEDK
jgi:nicotinamidase/pyrazinamidase